jgi:hypothetical protein
VSLPWRPEEREASTEEIILVTQIIEHCCSQFCTIEFCAFIVRFSPRVCPSLADLEVRLGSFFMRGINPTSADDKRYEISVAESIKSAAAVCIGLDAVGQTELLSHLWFLPGYGISAVIVLFSGPFFELVASRRCFANVSRTVSLLQKEEQHLDSTWERQLILLSRGYYAKSPLVGTPKSVPHQACLIIDQLLSSQRAGAAAIFRQTATKMMAPSNLSARHHHGLADYSLSHHQEGYASGSGGGAPREQPFADSLPSFPSLNLNLTLSRSYPSLPASRVHSPEPERGVEETFDATASRLALSSFAQLEVPGLGGHMSTDWSQILAGIDQRSGVLVDEGW